MTQQDLLRNLETLQAQNNLSKIEQYILKPELNHPLFYHVVVEKFVQADNLPKAMYYASQSSQFVNNDNGQYFNTIFGNSLGTMISFPLIKWKINSLNRLSIFKVLANAYIYLSNGINLSGLSVYDTIRTRSILVNKYARDFENLTNEYYAPYYDTKEITQAIIHDKVLANKAYLNVDKAEAQNALSSAKQLTNWYNNNFQENSEIEEIVAEGKEFHKSLYDALIDKFDDNEFIFSKEEYLQMIK